MAMIEKKESEKPEKDEVKLSDMFKKAVSLGVSAAFMTEDAVKNVLNDLPLPKDIVSGLLQNAKSAKEDFITSVGQELEKYLKNLDPYKLLDHLAERYDIEVQAKVKFKKKDENQAESAHENMEVNHKDEWAGPISKKKLLRNS